MSERSVEQVGDIGGEKGGSGWLRNRVLLLLDGGKRAHVTIMRPA